MSYIKPDFTRFKAQVRDNHMAIAGQTATWRQWVSAVSGNAAGFGTQNFYRQQTITALIGGYGQEGLARPNMQRQQPGGMFEAGEITIATQEKLSAADEVIWNGVRYRVDTVSQPSILDSHFVSILKRGDK